MSKTKPPIVVRGDGATLRQLAKRVEAAERRYEVYRGLLEDASRLLDEWGCGMSFYDTEKRLGIDANEVFVRIRAALAEGGAG